MELTERQWIALRLFLDPERARASWIHKNRRVLERVTQPLVPPPGAAGIRVWRTAGPESEEHAGAAEDRTQLRLPAALGLSPCWEVPFRTLNDLGRRLGEAPWNAPEAPIPLNANVPAELYRWVRDRARADNCTITDVTIQALNELRSRHR